jgi:protein-S-isoprenylcysteine O-methyltransferase Ste14
MKQKHFIDFHKSITFIAVLSMMAIYDQWENTTAWVYLALHGTYGILWVLKSRIFPDKTWEQQTGWGYALYILAGLSLYWIAPWLITSRGTHVPPWYLGLCISMNVFGVFFHYAADMQKHTNLKLAPEKLIQDGLMQRVRNMNYFGELLIYLGYGLLAMHWIPVAVIGAFIIIIWIPNMRRKDKSLSRYSEFDEYRQRSKLFIPFLG